MDGRVLFRATAVQAIAVGALFGLLVALPLPTSFFREYGAIVGPLSWVVCALLAASVLSLATRDALAAAAVSGALAVLAALAVGHSGGMLAGVAAFGATCGVLAERRGRHGDRGQRSARRLPGGGATPSPDPSHHAADP